MSPRLIRLAPVAALAWLVLAAVASPASAAVPCWKRLMNDWYSPPINKVYPIPCYHEAIKHLPTDVSVYSSARDDIERALQQAIADRKRPHRQATTAAPVTTTGPGTTTTSGSATPPPPKRPTTTTTTPKKPEKPKKGPVARAIRDITPGGADSFPLPLLILGLLAVLLVAAGVAGLVWKRLQLRRGGP